MPGEKVVQGKYQFTAANNLYSHKKITLTVLNQIYNITVLKTDIGNDRVQGRGGKSAKSKAA